MLLGVLKMYFLTQDTAHDQQDCSSDDQSARRESSRPRTLVSNTVCKLRASQWHRHVQYSLHAGDGISFADGHDAGALFSAFALGFAIKVPMFPFHTWLPDAHVEAPTAGSVILAGILLKLGTYGFYRFNLPMFPAASKDQSRTSERFGVRSVIVFLAIVSIIYGALAAMYFVVKKDGDVKKLVAYSSVSSMGMVMLGLFALNPNGVNGGGDADDQSRYLFRRALSSRRNNLRAETHAQRGGVWRTLARDAGLRGDLPRHGDDRDRAAAARCVYIGVSGTARSV